MDRDDVVSEAQDLVDVTSSLLPDSVDRLIVTNTNDESRNKTIYELVIERVKLELKEDDGDTLHITTLDYATGKVFSNEKESPQTLIDQFHCKITDILEDVSQNRSIVYEL